MATLAMKPLARRDRNVFAAVLSAAAVAMAGVPVLLSQELGQRSAHMAVHIAAMSVLAPALAAACASSLPRWIGRPRVVWLAAIVQLCLLWIWHLPAIERLATDAHGLHAAGHACLFLSAFVFWSAIIRAADQASWHAVAALLLSGKLTCLLSALLVFSPRVLYGAPFSAVQIEDQQLAGLLMITACPLSYLIAAVVIVARLVCRIPDVQMSARPGAG